MIGWRDNAVSRQHPRRRHATSPHRHRPLSGVALAEWTHIIADLETAGTLAKIDIEALYQYCCLFAEVERLVESRRKREKAADDDGGRRALNRFLRVERQLVHGRLRLLRYLSDFGMTPAGRARGMPASTPTAKH